MRPTRTRYYRVEGRRPGLGGTFLYGCPTTEADVARAIREAEAEHWTHISVTEVDETVLSRTYWKQWLEKGGGK